MAYRHVLVAADGSRASRKALRAASLVARACGARLTGVFVVAAGVPTAFSGEKLYGSGVMSPEMRRLARRQADRVLAEVTAQAASAGVRCQVLRRLAREPWRAILGVARSRGCDLIVMGSHGRSALPALILGSQTTHALARSKVPLLICR